MNGRHALALLVLACLAGACAGKKPPSLGELVENLDFANTPRLPSPVAGTYATVRESPRDPVLTPLLRDRHVDGALAGASGALALSIAEKKGSMSRWELREALWRAGYAYPVQDARAWTVGAGDPPSRELVAWLESVPKDEPMALVRARGRDVDVWVGMRSRPPIDLGLVPRVASLGTPVTLPPVPGATWQVTDASGQLRGGTLDQGATLALSSAGEWLVDVRREDRTELARFPIYVGIEPPELPLLRLSDPVNVATTADAERAFTQLLAHVRDAYGARPWKRSPIFDTAVRRYLEAPSSGSTEVLRSLGFSNARSIVWACDAPTVEACFDGWVWDVRRRRALLTGEMDGYGLHVELDPAGVHATLLLVGTDQP